MQKKPNRLLVVLPLLLSGLVNYQAYAGETPKSPVGTTNQQQATGASPGHNKAASEHVASKNAAPAAASSESTKTAQQPQVAATKAEVVSTPTELKSLSIIESILSVLLTAVFFLVLIRGNLFKHH